jgi:hypothetical protein
MVLWRVDVLETPPWHDACARCGRVAAHDSTGAFRVNANGARHDVWLLYRCRACGATKRRRLARRAGVAELPLAAYLANDPVLARRHAFEIAPREPLRYRVTRPPLPPSGRLAARLVLPEPCGERWDRFLARELGCSRGAVARRAASGALALTHGAELSRPLRDGQGFALC